MAAERTDAPALPEDVFMNLSSDAYVRVLWAFAKSVAKTCPDQRALGEELLRQLEKTVYPLMAKSDPDDQAASTWRGLIEAHASDLLFALGYAPPEASNDSPAR